MERAACSGVFFARVLHRIDPLYSLLPDLASNHKQMRVDILYFLHLPTRLKESNNESEYVAFSGKEGSSTMAPGCPRPAFSRSLAADRCPADLYRVGGTTGTVVLDGGCHARESAVRAQYRLVADDVPTVWRVVPAYSGEEMDIQEAGTPAGAVMQVTWYIGIAEQPARADKEL